MFCVYSADLELKNVYQSKHTLQHATFAGDALVAIIDCNKAIRVPFDQIEVLASKSISQLATMFKLSPELVLIQMPPQLEKYKPQDIVLCSPTRFVIPFSDGSIWDVDFKGLDNQSLVGLKYTQNARNPELAKVILSSNSVNATDTDDLVTAIDFL